MEGEPGKLIRQEGLVMPPVVEKIFQVQFDINNPNREAVVLALQQAQRERPEWNDYNLWHVLIGSNMETGRTFDSQSNDVLHFAEELAQRFKL